MHHSRLRTYNVEKDNVRNIPKRWPCQLHPYFDPPRVLLVILVNPLASSEGHVFPVKLNLST